MRRQIDLRAVMLVAAAIASTLGVGPPAAASTSTQQSAAVLNSGLPPQLPIDKHPKLDSHLLAVASATSSRGEAEGLRVARERKVTLVGDAVRVVIKLNGERSAARAAIRDAAGRVEAEYAERVQALVPVSALRKIADSPLVSYVAQPSVLIPAAVADEGVGATNANVWQTAGVTGASVKVAVIDLGFAGYTTAQTNDDLPGLLTTQDYCGGTMGSTDAHGTAVAEIVYKMAPGVQLYLICVNSTVTLGNAKDYAIAQGITIVNFSVGIFNSGRGDGTGAASSPDAIVADARAHGILWVNAAGNSGQRHWSGTFIDTNANLWHDFAAADELDNIGITSGAGVCVFLKWDSWPTTTQDFDLYLFKVTDLVNPVARSENSQTGSQPPTESFCYTNTTGVSQSFGIAIRKFSATATPRFDLFVDSGAPQYVVAAGSVVEPASSPNVMTVGAICFSTNSFEPYSSQGPTIDGRIKPDIAGQDATSSPVYGAGGCAGSGGSGNGGFTGTSASSPHVAGAAALVAQSNPTFTPTQLQSFLEGRALDLGPAGKDNQFGAGKLWLGIAPPPVAADVSVTLIAAPGPVVLGANLVYTATVASNAAATGVALTDTLPAEMTFISALASQGTCAGTLALSCSLGSLGSGATATVNIVVHPSVLGVASNTVTITANGSDPVPANNSATAPTTVVAASGGPYKPLTPARILDTRPGSGQPFAGQTLGLGSTLDVQVSGVGGVPATGVIAVVLNVTVTEPSVASFVTVFPTGVSRPLASSLNFVAGQTVPNLVEVTLGADGKVSFFNSGGSVDLIADVQGYVSSAVAGTAGFFNPLVPARILDTRPGSGQPHAGETMTIGSSLDLQVTGVGDVPSAGVSAVVLNVTVTAPTNAGFLTVFPTGDARPLASNLNFVPGQTVPNLVIAAVGSGGTVRIFNSAGNVDVIADIVGWFSDGTDPAATGSIFSGLTPARITDTRPGSGQANARLTLGTGGTLSVEFAGQGGVPVLGGPAAPTAAVLNVTVTEPNAASFLTVYPSGAARPLASNLNWVPGQTVPNLVVVKLGPDGKVNVFNSGGSVDVIVDVVGWYW